MTGANRRSNLTTTFRHDEVRLMAAIFQALLTDGEIVIPAESQDRERLLAVAAKFARLRAKIESGGGAW